MHSELTSVSFYFSIEAGIVSEQEVVCGVPGQSVVLAMESKNLTDFFDIIWKAGDDRIARLNNAIPSYYGDYHGNVEIFVNGTIRLNRAEQDDSGNYTVEVFDSNGKSIVRRSIQVYIQGEMLFVSRFVFCITADLFDSRNNEQYINCILMFSFLFHAIFNLFWLLRNKDHHFDRAVLLPKKKQLKKIISVTFFFLIYRSNMWLSWHLSCRTCRVTSCCRFSPYPFHHSSSEPTKKPR